MDLKRMMQEATKLQNKMKKSEEEFKAKEFEHDYKGYVKLKMNGDYKVLNVELNPTVVDPDDIDTLQDLVTAAFNELLTKVKEEDKKTKNSLVPGGMGSLF